MLRVEWATVLVEWFGIFTYLRADRMARPVHVATVLAEGGIFEGQVPVQEKKVCIHSPIARMTCSFFCREAEV